VSAVEIARIALAKDLARSQAVAGYISDLRVSHMIISGGVNIYPQEAENLLAVHPKVADVAVIGVPDPDMGEQVKAVVQPETMADAGPAAAIADYVLQAVSR
jgi:acyl-CoA synthetase (AMP-forming)/AMP-acid ligase II